MDLVKVSKQRLQVMRDDEWKSLLTEVSLFCTTHDISILNMDETFVVSGRPRRNTQQNTNLHHYRVELFYTIIDMQLHELNNRFSEANIDLLLCMAYLNPSNSFVVFDKEELIRLLSSIPLIFLGQIFWHLTLNCRITFLICVATTSFWSFKGLVNLLKS